MSQKGFRVKERLSVLERHPIVYGAEHLTRWPFHALGRRAQELARLSRKLAELNRAIANCQTPGEAFDTVQSFPEFRADQKRIEFLSLLELLALNPPNFLCEIGSASGGSLFLLARVCAPDATIVSVDFGLPLVRRLVHRQMAA